MRILQLSDIHYRTHYTNDNAYERLLAKLESPLKHLELCLQDALQYGEYDCLCLTGDICDNGSVDDYQTVESIVKKYFPEIPIIAIPGNHDNENYQQVFGTKSHTTFQLQNYTILALNNSEYGNANGEFEDEDFSWLDENLKTPEKKIILMHHPVRKYPGIPCLPQAEKFIQHIQNTNTILVMQGHVHWSEDYTINDTHYSVGPSTSFQGENNTENDSVSFYDVAGYKIYDLIDNHVSTKSYTIKKPTKVCSWKFTENKIQEIDVDINADI